MPYQITLSLDTSKISDHGAQKKYKKHSHNIHDTISTGFDDSTSDEWFLISVYPRLRWPAQISFMPEKMGVGDDDGTQRP